MSPFLLDANALIAMTVTEHEHHDAAATWLAGVEGFAICPVVEGSLVRFLLRIGETSATVMSAARTRNGSVSSRGRTSRIESFGP